MERQTDAGSRAWGDLARGGVIGGLVGGIVLAMLMMIVTAIMGMGLLRPLYLLAATFHAPWAMTNGVDVAPLLVGLMLHMVNSAIFGLIFALLLGAMMSTRSMSLTTWAIGGMVLGLLLFAVNQYLVLPIVAPAMATGVGTILIWWLLGHVMYGVVLGLIVGSPAGVRAAVPVGARQLA